MRTVARVSTLIPLALWGTKQINNYFGLAANGVGAIPNGNGLFLVAASRRRSSAAQLSPSAMSSPITSTAFQSTIPHRTKSSGAHQNRADGTASFGNSYGLAFNKASNNTVGGTSPGAGNLIAWNNGPGVGVYLNCVNNAIARNSIYSNHPQLGIELYDVADGGAQPTTTQAMPIVVQTTCRISLYSRRRFRMAGRPLFRARWIARSVRNSEIEFVSNNECDPTGFGQGESYLRFANVTTNASGHGSFTFNVPNANVVGGFFAATATDPNGNSSEFSACARELSVIPGTLQFSTDVISQLENGGASR